MNKTAIKNFAVWARNKLIADITYKAGLIGVSENGIAEPLPQSSRDLQFFDIGTRDYAQVAGSDIVQRNALVRAIQEKENTSDYQTACKTVIEEVAYTWFNRLIAIRFMEVNEYLPSRIRVLSSENLAKNEPDFVTTPFDTDMEFTTAEQDRIMQLKDENKLDDLFRMLFIKQCNKLHEILPELFEETNNYTELLLSISFTDSDGVVSHLVHDIEEDDFNVEKEGQVEIIGWMYQYYNIEPKDETFALLKKNVKITKERIPAATQLFTPDWIVRYMVENSLGRLWVEGHPSDSLKENWKYYLEEAEQEADVQVQLEKIREEYSKLNPEDIKVIDPCMGSGHILVYCFDVLMQIYESQGYTQRDAAQSILENNLFGLDIDKRAAQLAYFAVMMKARQYNRRILNGENTCHVYAIQESNHINRDHLCFLGMGMDEMERNTAKLQLEGLLDTLTDAKEYGSILNVENYNWELLRQFVAAADTDGQVTLDSWGVEETVEQLKQLVEIGETMARKYWVTVTNPPYAVTANLTSKVNEYVKKLYNDSKADLFAVFIERCKELTIPDGYQAMITQHSWMFLSSFEKMREKLFEIETVNMAHLGARAFEEIGGEVVQTTSFIMLNQYIQNYKGVYCRLVEPNSQVGKELMYLSGKNRYVVSKEAFFKIPGKPVAYWASEKMLAMYDSGRTLGTEYKTITGSSTGENATFLKLWQEVSSTKIGFNLTSKYNGFGYKWIPCNKGGSFRRWYGNQEWVINWESDGIELKAFATKKNNGKHWSRFLKSLDCFYHEGVTWSKVSTGVFSCRYMPEGFIMESAACAIMPLHQDVDLMLALMNTKITQMVLRMKNPTINMQTGDVVAVPIVDMTKDRSVVDTLAKNNIEIAKFDWDSFETSWDFKKHPLLRPVSTISEAFTQWESECDERFNQLKANEEELNRIFIDIYGLQDELTPEVEDKDVTVRKADLQRDIKSLISYAVGCMFGRYSLNKPGLAYAGGDWSSVFQKNPTVIDIGNNDGSTATLVGDYIMGDDKQYHLCTFVPDKDNCIPITDEEYFEDDIVGLFVAWLKKVYGAESLEGNLEFIAKALGNKGATSREVIRNYFLKDFFTDHCKIYQKRPIYWLFDSGKQNGFKALVYMHRWNADTVGNLRVEYLHKMQHIYEREIVRMQETIDNSHDSREVSKATKRKDKLQKQLKETKDYDAKLAHIALSRIDIDLDDGVKVNYEKVQTAKDGKKMQILAKI